MLELQDYQYGELIEKNREELNKRLLEEIRKTGNTLFGFFYDKLNDPQISKTKTFIEKLKHDNAKATRIKWREFHYQHLNNIQRSILGMLKQFFDKKFPEIASDPKIGGLYFNQDLKDIVRFDFIFGYVPHNSFTSDDVDNYTAKFFLQGGFKKKQEKEEIKTKTKKEKVRLASEHKLVNTDNYTEYRDSIISGIKFSVNEYSQRLNIDTKDPLKYKIFIERYFIYLFKNALFQNKLVLDIKSNRKSEMFKEIIEDIIEYFNKQIGSELDIDIGIIVKKFFRNINSDNIPPLEFTYINTTLEDIFQRQDYFDKTYFSKNDVSSKIIYAQIMEEFGSQGDQIKMAHAFYSPDYFVMKNKKEKLESDLYRLNSCEPKDINLQNIIDSTNEELFSIISDMDKHFYSKVDKDKRKGKGDSMEKIMQKYMKYYKIPLQYRRNFFILINYLNHHYKLKSDVNKKAKDFNQKLEEKLINSPDQDREILNFLRDYITQKYINELIDKKRDKNYQLKINELRKKTGAFYTQNNLDIDNVKKDHKEEIQLSLNF
ncbi:hypothetical protein K9M48_01880 [Candidatus Gracilibacteria bacterium]|nr:hypothetical protein [Candidatus Gracilibacteria bacterium]